MRRTQPMTRDYTPDPWFIGSTTLEHCTVDCYMPTLGRLMLRWACHTAPSTVHTTYIVLGAHASDEERMAAVADALRCIDDTAIQYLYGAGQGDGLATE